MTGHHLHTAWLNMRRSPWLTGLTVLAIAVGIGSSMTVYSVYRALSRDPIPGKSAQLYAPRLDTLGPDNRDRGIRPGAGDGEPDFYMAYKDAVAIRDQGPAPRRAAMYQASFVVRPEEPGAQSYGLVVRATDVDFFDMFEVPFQQDGRSHPWSRAENDAGARVVVLSEQVALRLFGTTDVVGRRILLDQHAFLITGVTKRWRPQPRFYDISFNLPIPFSSHDTIFVPFSTATALLDGPPAGIPVCPRDRSGRSPVPRNQEEYLASECIWTQLWVELPTEADRKQFDAWLRHYAAAQRSSGRFDWLPTARLRNVRETLVAYSVIPDEYRVAALLAFGFLVACLINAIGLMAARFQRRAGELVLRRALGASRRSLFAQCLTETALLGALGGMGGLLLLALGLWVQGRMMAGTFGLAVHDARLVLLAVLLAVAGAVLAGLYPAWRASRASSVAGKDDGRHGLSATVLIVTQLALTLALVTNALFVVWQKLEVIWPATGIDEPNLMVISNIWPRGTGDLPARVARDLRELRSLPDVVDAAVGNFPLTTADFPVSTSAEPGAPWTGAALHVVDDHTLGTWGAKTVAGSWFGPQDVSLGRPPGRLPEKVAINRALADHYWPDGPAVGQRLYVHRLRSETGGPVEVIVVAVIDGVPGSRLTGSPYSFFLPMLAASAGRSWYMVRARPGTLPVVMRQVEQRLRDIDPSRAFVELDGPPLGGIGSFSGNRRDADLATWDQVTTLVFTCVLLLGINVLGIVGMTWYWISRRRRQIGIRRALGAGRFDILLHFQRQNLAIVGMGVAIGATLAIAGNRWLMQHDPVSRMPTVVVLAGALSIVLLSQLAVFWPARHASLIPPALATRAE